MVAADYNKIKPALNVICGVQTANIYFRLTSKEWKIEQPITVKIIANGLYCLGSRQIVVEKFKALFPILA